LRLDRIAAVLLAAILATSSASGGAWERDHSASAFQPSCTAELQRCLAKLETLQLRQQFYEGIEDWSRVERALLRLQETNPECALLLEGAGLQGL
jgi:hypothetical protein